MLIMFHCFNAYPQIRWAPLRAQIKARYDSWPRSTGLPARAQIETRYYRWSRSTRFPPWTQPCIEIGIWFCLSMRERLLPGPTDAVPSRTWTMQIVRLRAPGHADSRKFYRYW